MILKVKKINLFLYTVYLIFVLVVFTAVERDKKIYKNAYDRKVSRFICIFLILFAVYNLVNYFFELIHYLKMQFFILINYRKV